MNIRNVVYDHLEAYEFVEAYKLLVNNLVKLIFVIPKFMVIS
jgi:hypothetical protein